MGLNMAQLPDDVVEMISHRLASTQDLRLPGNLTKSGEQPSLQKRKEYVRALLLRDPGVFLERYGELLDAQGRAAFEPLRGDYEVDFYLKMLEDRQNSHKQEIEHKNRRLAYMNRLLREGTYFSDEAMKERQPYLHHQYVGQYTPPGEAAPGSAPAPGTAGAGQAGSAAAAGGGAEGEMRQAREQGDGSISGSGGAGGPGRPWQGMALSQSLLRHQEELEAMLARRAEEERYDRMEEESESEDDSEEEEEGGGAGSARGDNQAAQRGKRQAEQRGQNGGGGAEEGDGGGLGYVQISDVERRENADAFLDLMQERFLRGQESGVDYRAIDADASLDDDWAEQAGRDAEEKYFEEED